ncbi:vesicle transport protein USE1-like isoform X3 [Rhynchophorus ferrugineus]|uniref:vesicle transport protein USE1-like isoform X3 n=1 Tax=Rhynchophorus ferrugineus TaxID=354439 RepID=UPI003FCDAB4E
MTVHFCVFEFKKYTSVYFGKVMGLSRHEINLRRLLVRCELMCKNQKDDERFEKYIETLETMVQDMKKHAGTSIESLKDYQKRIMNIKSALGIKTPSKYDEFNDPLIMREDLLGLRQRNLPQPTVNTEDLNEVIKYHDNIQKKLTDDMLEFTKTLKEQSELANKIIKKDTEVVSNSAHLSDNNILKLETESSKLAEHSKRAWKCWMWVMLVIVLVIFINMVLFMKLVKKST